MTPSRWLPHEIRSRIASDHALLRGLLGALVATARAAIRDEEHRPVVPALLAQLRAEVERHLEAEERSLVPLLRAADAWGSSRVESSLAKEHALQRAMLVALVGGAEDGARAAEDLAGDILTFARRFEEDMAIEEERLFALLTHHASVGGHAAAVSTEG